MRLVTLGEGTAEIAHEVLIRQWPTLRGWLDEDREGLRRHRRLSDAAQLWDDGGRESDLYRGIRLAAAEEWACDHGEELNATEQAFLDAGVVRVDAERRSQLRSNRRLRPCWRRDSSSSSPSPPAQLPSTSGAAANERACEERRCNGSPQSLAIGPDDITTGACWRSKRRGA